MQKSEIFEYALMKRQQDNQVIKYGASIVQSNFSD